MWRLRNRLIVTYTFIGVIPVVLLLVMGLIVTYLFVGQFATYVASSDLQAELKSLEAVNSRLASEVAIALRSGRPLTAEQLATLRAEEKPGSEGRDELLALMETVFHRAEATVRALDPAMLTEPRTIGRKALPTTVIGLLTHIAEHIQRHIGQAISAAKLSRTL